MLNLAKIKQTKLFENARRMCQTDKLFMPDQSSINKLCVSKKIVERKYNEQKRTQDDTIFRHFTTTFKFIPWFRAVTIKPWDIEKIHQNLKIFEFDDILEEYKNIKNNI